MRILFLRAMCVAGFAGAMLLGPMGAASHAFSPGSHCADGRISSAWSPAGKWAQAWINSNPGTSCYVRVVATCQRDNGGVQNYNGAIRSFSGSPSSYDCDSNATYNHGITSYGWQVSASS